MSDDYDKERNTVPLVRLLGLEEMARGFWSKATNEVYRVADNSNSLVDTHKEVFGPQTYCFNGSDRRFWVWEFDGYRVFVANGYGLALEVELDTTRDDAEEMMRTYIDQWEPYLDEHLDERYPEWEQRMLEELHDRR